VLDNVDAKLEEEAAETVDVAAVFELVERVVLVAAKVVIVD
jgi:hypothetical protein